VFYDQDKSSIGEIDLDYFKPNSAYPRHCIAARITAENPDEGFKPTSGKIERIVFQSNQKARHRRRRPSAPLCRRCPSAAAPLPPPLCRRPSAAAPLPPPSNTLLCPPNHRRRGRPVPRPVPRP